MLEHAKQWASSLKREVMALWVAARDQRTPIAAKVVALLVTTYALSPIDLIPDFVPVLGYLDDLLIVPLGIAVAVRMIPPPLMAEFRQKAAQMPRSKSWLGLAFIICVWLVALALFLKWLF